MTAIPKSTWAFLWTLALFLPLDVGHNAAGIAFADEQESLAVSASMGLVVPHCGVALHVAVGLPDGTSPAAGSAWQLVGDALEDTALSAQLMPTMAQDGTVDERQLTLAATIPPATPAQARRFILQALPKKSSPKYPFTFVDVDDASVKLVDGDRPVFVYNHGAIARTDIPENDCRRKRSCYLHPVWGLNGEVLTDDFPKDHYHHHGLFWAWPHVTIAGKEHDLWSQATNGVAGVNGDIQNKFVRWLCRGVGPAAAVLAVENGWFVGEKKVMIERVWLRTYAVSENTRSLDLEFVWIPVGDPVTLRGSDGSYGGVSMRFAVGSPKDAVITVPSGIQQEDAGSVRLPWADMTYSFAGGDSRSGAAIFVAPSHLDYPPAWLLRHYGPLCVSWPGTTERTFQPNMPIRLNYRLWIHNSTVTVDDLRKAYDGYAAAAKVHWE